MGLFSAIGKGVLRYANDKNAERQRKKAKDVAYKKTGKDMKSSNKRGKYINGSATYRKYLTEEYARIAENHKHMEYFINDV